MLYCTTEITVSFFASLINFRSHVLKFNKIVLILEFDRDFCVSDVLKSPRRPTKGCKVRLQEREHQGCSLIDWEKGKLLFDWFSKLWNLLSVCLDDIRFDDCDLHKVSTVKLKNVEIFVDGLQLHPFFATLTASNFTRLELVGCRISKLNDAFFDGLPSSIYALNLENNDITSISESISKLQKLRELNLKGNLKLTNNTFPWCSLPRGIKFLNLLDTGFTHVPSEVCRLMELNLFAISSKLIKVSLLLKPPGNWMISSF